LLELREYLDERGRSAFGRWFQTLDAVTAARVTAALYRLREGNTSALKALGGGLLELRLHFGAGYRIYMARDGAKILLLLGGGSKRRQTFDITAARAAWREYVRRSG
jgi:putative addiction module killer protein